MAVTTHIPAQSGFLAALDRAASAFANFIVSISVSHSRARQLAALSELSDEALAKKGLKREDLVRYVFRDVYYV